MCAYRWPGGGELLLSAGNRKIASSLFELSSKDIILFINKHPEAISARNLLRCTVVGLLKRRKNRRGTGL